MRRILLIMWTAFQSFILRHTNNNNNIPRNGFQHQFLKWGAEESVHINRGLPASRSVEKCVKLFLCGRPQDRGIVSIRTRVRSDVILY